MNQDTSIQIQGSLRIAALPPQVHRGRRQIIGMLPSVGDTAHLPSRFDGARRCLFRVNIRVRRTTPLWGTADAEMKHPSVENPDLKVLPFKPGAGLYIALRATPTTGDFFLAKFYPSGPFTCVLSKTSPEFFLCWLWLTPVPVRACRIKQVTLLIVTDN